MIPLNTSAKTKTGKDLQPPEILRAQGRAQNTPETAPEAVAIDADLAAVVAAWPELPKATRRRILALAKGGK